MIRDLRYAVTFPSNGVHLSGEHSFQPGITAVTGRNGTGKSFGSAEMIRYGLFGKKALRGPASDYKTLDMSLSFDVGDRKFLVSRNRKSELLLEGDEQLAVGADAVNKKVVEILGFGLDVFDVVCAAKQKDSERLSQLTPARRKELIDEVVGLAQNEVVERACRDEANGLKREAEALTRTLVAPTVPVEPEGYRASSKIEKDLRETKALVEKRAALQRTIDSVGETPVEPVLPEADVTEIEAHERNRLEAAARYRILFSNIERIPDTTHTRAQLDAAAALLVYDAEVARRGPRPAHSDEQLLAWARLWVQKADAERSATCPKCSYEFNPAVDVDVATIRAMPDPPLSREEIREEQDRAHRWREPIVEPKGERLTQAEITTGALALDRAAEKKAMQTELDAIEDLPDRSEELAQARATATAWAIYRIALEQFDCRAKAASEAWDELGKLPLPKHTVEALDAAFVAARIYETQLASYAEQRTRFDALSAEIAEKQEKAEAFAAGAKGLVEARRTLKAFLAPSLSRVASTILAQMTANSKRPFYSVEIDEDMNIVIDGQDIGTLSGAQATAANLAVRIALGRVLVSRVFPVFIGDEIDADMDELNAQETAGALGSLRGQLSQIIIISHKQLEQVDQEIDFDA